MKWFKIYGERWFTGSTRWELTTEQRAVWIDLLARASINEPRGQIDYYSLEQLAQQFNIGLELLRETIKRCEEEKKIKFLSKSKKIKVINWKKYQSEYDRQATYRKQVKGNSGVTKDNDNFRNKVTSRKEGEGEEKRKEEEKKKIGEDEKLENSSNPNPSSSNTPLPSNSTPSFNERVITKKEQFLSMLKGCAGYPFNETKDSFLFDASVTEFPDINIIEQTKKKIGWWEYHPEALKAKPRQKLEEWFKEEAEFKKRGGPQPLGEIMEEVKDPNHRNFLKKAILDEKKSKGEEPY
jgi:hypothetical protein